jgi:ABC-type nitrate/sulfonate/bicarbonate transport system substrate-binding protein
VVFGWLLVLAFGCQSPAQSTSPAAPAVPAASNPAGSAPAAQGGDPFRVANRTIRVAFPIEDMVQLPLRIALVENLFARRGLTAELHRVNATVGLAGITTGDFDYMSTFAVAITSTMRSIPLKLLVMMEQDSPMVLVARSDIRSGAELRGKKIGSSSPGGVHEFAVRAMVQAAGLNPDRDVEIFALGDAGRLPALDTGQVDAIIADPPQSTLLVQRGFNVVARAAPVLPDLAISATATIPERIANEPAEVKAFAAAVIEALQYLHANREGSARIASEWLSMPPDVALAAYDDSIAAFSKDGSFSEGALRRGVEIQRQRDPSLTWDGPLSDLVAGDLLAEVQRGLGVAAR